MCSDEQLQHSAIQSYTVVASTRGNECPLSLLLFTNCGGVLEPAWKLRYGTEIKGFNVRVGGGLGGREPRRDRSLDVFVEPENAYDIVRAFVELYHEKGNRQNRNKNRARFFVDEWGTEAILSALEERVAFEL